jgi:hypothetical protein|tara:strand:- start:31 stop:243 length:213 start_codon:yes stop_codon:yes gene_type:complete
MKNLYPIFIFSASTAFIFYSLAPHVLFLCGLLPFFDMPYTYQRELLSEYGYYIAFLGALFGGRLGWLLRY